MRWPLLMVTRLMLAVIGAVGLTTGVRAAQPEAPQPVLRVCADPNDMPFSNAKQQGFENRLAQFVAEQLHERVVYTWWPQRNHYVKKALNKRRCDLLMGVASELDSLATTRPYYRSTYVFVWRADRHLDISAITDPRLKHLRIGVQLIGDDDFNTPPAHALGDQGVVDNVVGFPVYAFSNDPDPAARIMSAVQSGRIDIAAVWGPLAGYFAKTSPVPLRVVPITDTARLAPLPFEFDISMGVRKQDQALRARLDGVIGRNQPQIDAILRSYGVPLVHAASPTVTPASTAAQRNNED